MSEEVVFYLAAKNAEVAKANECMCRFFSALFAFFAAKEPKTRKVEEICEEAFFQ